MRLAKFLESAKQAPVKPVTFKAQSISPAGIPQLVEVQATLVFVNDAQREESIREAAKVLRERHVVKDDEGNVTEYLPIPDHSRMEEELYQLMFWALRDSEELGEHFAGSAMALRRAMNVQALNGVVAEYNAFVAKEFPAKVTKQQMNELIEEAKKNSMSDQPGSGAS